MTGPEKTTVIHPGFVKTATKTLQFNLFSKHSQIAYLGWPAATDALDLAIRSMAYEDSETYDERRTAYPFMEFCKTTSAERRVIVLSHENFALYEATDRGVVAQRLVSLFPQARILFTIRRQQDLLTTWYLQKLRKYLKGGHYLSFEEWMRLKRKEPHKSILSNLDYSKTILNYARLFGRERVLVLTFEQMQADLGAFSASLGAWLQIDPAEIHRLLQEAPRNPSRTTAYAAYYQYVGRFLPRKLSHRIGDRVVAHMPIGRKVQVTLDQSTEHLLRSLCAEGNRKLEEAFGLHLRQHDYFV